MTNNPDQKREVMTVESLLEALETACAQGMGKKKMRIPIETGRVTMGSSPSAGVLDIHMGIDWNSKSMFLEVDQPLGVAGEKLESLKRTSRRATDTMYRIDSILKDGRYTQEVKLKLIGEWLNKFWAKE